MDTLIDRQKFIVPIRTFEYVLVLILFIFLVLMHTVFQPPLFANDLLASNSLSIPSLKQLSDNIYEEINPEILTDKFNRRIDEKYKGKKVFTVTEGIKHIKFIKYYNGKPVRLNVVEINRRIANDYEIKPATASVTLANKRTLKNIAQNTNSIVAINGGFFKPQTGVPLGTLMINKKLYTGPIYDRVALGIFKDSYDVGRVQLDAKIVGNNHEIKIDNINQPRILSSYILAYTKDWGEVAPASPQYGVQLQIVGNKILAASANPLSIPENGYVIVGPKSKLEKLFGAKFVYVEISTNPKWENVEHIISGGPYLVKDGQIFIDTTAQKLQSIGGRNPRTAIGYTKDNDLIMVTADGREGSSIGLTLKELADLMMELGCINAINLDGGASTVMYVNGQIVNKPQHTGGIALSNALVVSKKNLE
ncbi:MAG: phosphodiester glycosidase family protein [Cyanobacteria bacterium SIG26]|nr:phosphodiester glycosidase family protein [Cyanobacteria bacterium SIG26]